MSEPHGHVPVIAEEVEVGRRVVERGRVRIEKTVHEHVATVAVPPLERRDVEIERVPVDRVVERAEGTRTEGDVTIVPVYEERLVLHRQLVLKEELHVRRTLTREPQPPARVALRRERIDIRRDDAVAEDNDETPS